MEKDLLKLPEFLFEEYPREKYTFNVPHDDDLLFSENETWAYIKDGRAIVGVTDWAQRIMGDLLYFTPPEVGAEIEQFASLGELESGKAVLEMASPLSGKVIAVNEAVVDAPELVTEEPFGKGWICQLQLTDLEGERDMLLDFEEYFPLMKRKADDYNG